MRTYLSTLKKLLLMVGFLKNPFGLIDDNDFLLMTKTN